MKCHDHETLSIAWLGSLLRRRRFKLKAIPMRDIHTNANKTTSVLDTVIKFQKQQ